MTTFYFELHCTFRRSA